MSCHAAGRRQIGKAAIRQHFRRRHQHAIDQRLRRQADRAGDGVPL